MHSSAAASSVKHLFEDATIEQFAQAQIPAVLGKILFSLSSQPEFSGKNVQDAIYLKAVADNLREFSRAVSASVEAMICDHQQLASAVQNIGIIALGGQSVPTGSFILSFGGFYAAVRAPGEPNGMTAGRTPRLIWVEMPLSCSDVPNAFRPSISGLQTSGLQGLEYAQLPFCRGGVLWHLWFPAAQAGADADAFVIVLDGPDGDELYNLDWTNEPFYRLNVMKRFRFSSHPEVYIRCFFHLVRGKLGRFNILEDEQDLDGPISWRKDIDNWEMAVADAKANIRQFLMPLTRSTFKASGDAVFRCCVLFKNAVFHTDVVLNPAGTLELANEDLKIENLPVLVTDGLGQPQEDDPTRAPTEGGDDDGGQP